MAIPAISIPPTKPPQPFVSSSSTVPLNVRTHPIRRIHTPNRSITIHSSAGCISWNPKAMGALLGAGLFGLTALVGPACSAELPSLLSSSLQFTEPPNALSLPTWAVHVSSVVEWVTAMALVWQYGEKPGYKSWKSLSWGMVPLLAGALCACTWHFFYNSESLEVLVVLQAALTVIGNATMCFAAFHIYESSKGRSNNS